MTKSTIARFHQDSPEVLKGNIIKTLAEVHGLEPEKNRLWRDMNRFADMAEDKKTFIPGRRGLVKTLGAARKIVRRQAEMPAVSRYWEEAIEASATFVRAENAKGHKGQKLFETTLLPAFVVLGSRVNGFLTGEETSAELLKAIDALTFRTNTFVWEGRFCSDCGDPIPAKWQKCQAHYVRKPAALPALVKPVHKVKKPGSASKRHTGKTGGMGRPNAGDGEKKRAKEAKNAARRGEGK